MKRPGWWILARNNARFGRCVLLFGLLLLAACQTAPPPPPPPQDPFAACLMDLEQRRIVFQRVPDWQTSDGCGIQGAVKVTASLIPWNRSLLLSCPLAAKINEFEATAVQPLAQRWLGQRVKRMLNAGSYDCRGQRGDHPDRLSEHALGRAIDLTGFELEDGTSVSIRHDWAGNGAKARFLHHLAGAACKIFNMVITPDANALHHDHFHLDIGPYKACSVATRPEAN